MIYTQESSQSGCCTINGHIHQSCFCDGDISVKNDTCKKLCDEDKNCKAYSSSSGTTTFCQLATTSACPPSNNCKQRDSEVSILDGCPKDTMPDYTGCFVKKEGKLIHSVDISS